MLPVARNVLLGSVALLILSACQSTNVVRESNIIVPTEFDEAKAAKGSEDISSWWAQWQDPLLTQLIERGLRDSYDIKIAESRLTEALAVSRLATADLGAQVGANASLNAMDTAAKLSLSDAQKNALGAAASLLEQQVDVDGGTATVGFSASWEPDIFGKKRSDADAAYYGALGMQEKVYGTQLLVSNQIAEHYLQARSIEKRAQIIERNLGILNKYQRYVQERFNAGQTTIAEVNNIKSKINALRAQKSTLMSEYDAQGRSIAILTGQIPQNFTLPKANIDIFAQLPDAPSGQTPQGLLERRPDIRAYAAMVRSYSAKLASAEADLLPRFSIRFLGMGGHIEVDSNVPDLSSWGSLLNVGIQMPLFTNGRIQANIDAADARLQTALLQYDQSILRALGEVDSAYQAHYALKEQDKLLKTAYRQVKQRANDANQLFRYGHHTLDKALDAELEAQEVEKNLTQSNLAQAKMLLNLYKALGGGWGAHTAYNDTAANELATWSLSTQKTQ